MSRLCAVVFLVLAAAARGADEGAVRREAERQVSSGMIAGAVLASNRTEPTAVGVAANSLFDIASVTKTFVAVLCARLAAQGRIDVDASFTRYLPEHVLAKESCDITVRDLAMHVGGFASERSYQRTKSYAECRRIALAYRPVRARREAFEYSCLNYVYLGWIAERVTGLRLDEAVKAHVLEPLGLGDTRWGPVEGDARVVRIPCSPNAVGRISDNGANSVSPNPVGNAGIFTSAGDLLVFVRTLLERKVFEQKAFDLLFTCAYDKGGDRRSFGFDMSAAHRPRGLSDRTISHSGWSGQTVAVDPVTGFCGVCLTARAGGHGACKRGRARLLSLMAGVPEPVFGTAVTAGVPRIAVDGVPVAGTAAMPSPNVPPGTSAEVLKPFDEAGVRFYSDVWTMKDTRYNPRHWWFDEGQYDWTVFDGMAKGLLDASPDGYIFPRVKIDPPAKWLDAHPEEKYPFVEDKPDSREVKPDSAAWRKLYRGMLKDMLDHVAQTDYADRVMGYHLGAFHCGEWLVWPLTADFLPPSPVADGRDPLPPANLTAARQAALERLTDGLATAAIDAGRTLRELTGGTKLIGGFFGYCSGSHEKMRRVIESSAFDFFAAPPLYGESRAPGHPGCSQAFHQASFRLHGKVFYEESDYRTFLSDPAQRKQWGVQLLERDDAVGVIRRSIGKCLAGSGENWWFLLGGNATYSDPKMMESIRIGAETEKATLATAAWRPAEVAVFTSADEFETGYAANVGRFREQCKEAFHRDVLPTCGVPYDAYELGDIAAENLPDYKVYVFPNAFTLTDELRAKIKARVRRPGKTAVWVYAPGYYRDGIGHATNVTDLVDMPIRETYPVADGPYSRRFTAEGDGIVARDGARSVFLSLPPDAKTLRETFRAAGAHVWLETPDVLSAGRGFVMVHAAEGGVKRLKLPGTFDATEIFGAASPQTGVGEIVETLAHGETRVYRIR